MDYIEDYTDSSADYQIETEIINAVENYKVGDSATPYKVLIIPQNGIGLCTSLDGEEIATIVDDEIIELAENNKGVFGYITDVDYDDDGKFKYNVWFRIKVSRSIPSLSLEQDSDTLGNVETKQDSETDEKKELSTPPSISD